MWKCCTSNCVHKWSILLQQWHTCTSAAWVYEGHHDSSTPSSFGSYSFGMFGVTNYAHLALPRKTLRMTRINLSVITPWKPVDLHSVFSSYFHIYKLIKIEFIIPTRNVEGITGGEENAALHHGKATMKIIMMLLRFLMWVHFLFMW